MHEHLKFNVPDPFHPKPLFSALAGRYAIHKAPPVRSKMVIFDTFDWRLFKRSLVLYASESKLFLRKLFKNTPMNSAAMASPPVFVWDFPDGQMKDHLSAVIKMRALIEIAELHSRSTVIRILNRDEKTVARLVHEEFKLAREEKSPVLTTYLWLQPVKGYPKPCQNLIKIFEEFGCAVLKKEDLYFKAVEATGKQPGSYSSKFKIQLDPALRADEAAKIIWRYLLQVIKINEANIEKDLDTEFLHDFRVAIRRTRSALVLMKTVFPQIVIGRYKKDFALVGRLSNQLRDLDVYLLKSDAFKAMLPPVLRDHIDPLFDRLRKNRSKALQEVIRGLKSKRYGQIMQDWEAFLDEPMQDPPLAPNASMPIVAFARKRIYKQYRRIVKDGSRALENTEDEKLHALRIACKKLRYLMEFFSSLFPRKKINVLINQLKTLQDNLGDFNDLCVQEAYLLNIAKETSPSGQKQKNLLLAIGSLIGNLNREKQLVKDAFANTFAGYASPPNKIAFSELFASGKKETAR